ncbi:hypothetical protein SETIT_1G079100v2 [Setaria italica]|uniref:Leucine-rich repeat-containing N-terminal plant-type domain-containing protein n=1 Tax=Setaria italica TaxID=4555 RepID=A0A368PHZ1_SETIT|nr:hypothetical protein SETIT_1G079100v2 [Setaria italica]
MALHQLLQIPFSVLTICSAKVINPEAEALLRRRSTLDAPISLSSWSLANSTCSWFGVTCDGGAGHVAELNLHETGLSGKLDAFYSTAFQNLTRLDLSTRQQPRCNSLSGAIPYQLSQLPRIARLNLGNNHLTNPESGKFSPMPGLKSLSLANNGLNSTFPWFILNFTGRLQKLQILYLYENNLTGASFVSLGLDSSQDYFQLSGNNLKGRNYLSLSGNKLTCSI